MFKLLKSLIGPTASGKKIFAGMETPESDFKIVATHVREGKTPENYMLDDPGNLKSIVEKWRFEPGNAVGRCGYDYQIVFTNGGVNIPISVCFLCNTLVFNGLENYKTSKKQIMTLLKEDFNLL